MLIRGSLFILLIFSSLLFGAGVKASVDENPIIAGESVEFAIEAEGEQVQFPKIEKIGEYRVTAEGSQRLERFEDNTNKVKWIKLYAFTPKKSVTIPSFDVFVDGKKAVTEPIFVQVKPNSQQQTNDFSIQIIADRAEAYIGQMVDVKVLFKEKRNVPVMNVDFVPIKFEDFWVKRVGKEKLYPEGDYLVHEIHYLFFPQKAGALTIGPAEVKVAVAKKMRDAFGFIVRKPKWITITSSSLKLTVNPLPQNVNLIGNFKLIVQAEPKMVEAGKPVKLVVRVEAEGNIEDFNLPELHIDGVTIYSEEPKLEQSFSSGIYSGSWEREYVLIAERSFVIPSFDLKYFDLKTEKVKEIKTEPIEIEVIGSATQQKSSIDKVKPVKQFKKERKMSLFYIIIPFLAGMGFMYLLIRLKGIKTDKQSSKQSKKQDMLQQLLPFVQVSKEAYDLAERLSSPDYTISKNDKKAFEKLMKRYKN
ncbi:BatD family protein [Hydrogenimonas thermophila]|uniref:BatD family protein n=1 Tax=Hydrogenimonas thermophila TaxID=223786 RepID=UPI002936E494|nr:BatD family protein [Hydrogenimonas thermophila]WOE70404.1 BatD family protein [Hydrogenimonas thermophila]WOE72919.1 BatD family protein [Hydrogenimonas thermophila]